MHINLVIFLLSLCSNAFLIKYLLKNKCFQPQRSEKIKIPTFGGISFLLVMFLLFFFKKVGFSFFAYVFFSGTIGFLDDFLKVSKKTTDGLSSSLKIKLEFLGAFLFLLFENYHKAYLIYPVISLFFCAFFLVSMINAVNLSDGMDGLSSILSVFCFLFLYLKTGDSLYLNFIFMLLGFLVFNFPPAKIYMGDVGALSLGSILGVLFFRNNLEWSVLLVGIVFCIQAISSLIQIVSIRMFSKRIFLLAPFHHHLLLKNWTKLQVMLLFYFITFLGLLFSLYIF
ncbi:hypothetical protein [Alphaproteobacteria bacterium endosymbiont of Tiliacea citrago]|uniref:hypothetical protein n=1 Tax=Alphaproteobacteria bacterium endosymbiont of Tiliacea citrago TaxID=3077944 RepID=UPI00313EAC73